MVPGQSSGKLPDPYTGGPDSSTWSPVSHTPLAGRCTSRSLSVCPRPRCSSSAAVPPRSSVIASPTSTVGGVITISAHSPRGSSPAAISPASIGRS